jgi:arylsulfatase
MGLAPALAAQVPNTARPKQSKPNILFLMADQLRADCVGVYGNRVIQTPNLDRLAREGVTFTSAYSSVPSCTPARSALLTGLSPWRHGMLGMTHMAARYPLEKPRALAEAGYYAAAIGKNHFHPIRNPHGYHQMLLDEHCAPGHKWQDERCDYEAWFWSQMPTGDPHATGLTWNDYRGKAFVLPERLHATTWTGDTAVNFLQTYERPEPFFLKVSFIRPHSPYDPPARWMKKYESANIPAPTAGKWAQRYVPRSDNGTDIWHGEVSPDEARRSRQAYYGSVSHVDEQIGRILDVLDRRKMLDDTLIVFLSDHGDMLGDHHLWRKTYAYEHSARIPMLMRWPKGMLSDKRGLTRPEPVELRDILPTFLEAAGHTPSRPIDGRSLLSLVRNEGRGWRDWIDLEHNICYSPTNHWNALTDGRWKYIFHARDGEQQLFNLEKDRQELHDLASDTQHQSTLNKWRGRLWEYLSERGSEFVKGGELALRPQGRMISPNFPVESQRTAAD